jgi:hypothetical protein
MATTDTDTRTLVAAALVPGDRIATKRGPRTVLAVNPRELCLNVKVHAPYTPTGYQIWGLAYDREIEVLSP